MCDFRRFTWIIALNSASCGAFHACMHVRECSYLMTIAFVLCASWCVPASSDYSEYVMMVNYVDWLYVYQPRSIDREPRHVIWILHCDDCGVHAWRRSQADPACSGVYIEWTVSFFYRRPTHIASSLLSCTCMGNWTNCTLFLSLLAHNNHKALTTLYGAHACLPAHVQGTRTPHSRTIYWPRERLLSRSTSFKREFHSIWCTCHNWA